MLADVVTQGDVAVWAEAEQRAEVNGDDRNGLQPAGTLVIWTSPPGRAELQAALAQVQPATVILVGADPGFAEMLPFLTRLAGLIKGRMASGEPIPVSWLAAATAQSEATARAGVRWLALQGHIRVVDETGAGLRIEPGNGEPLGDPAAAEAALTTLLRETAAYRRYFARAAVRCRVGINR